MKSVIPGIKSTDNAKEEMEGIKKDIENIVNRLGNIKDNAGDIMSEQLEELNNALSSLKQKGIRKSEDSIEELCESTRKHPIRNLAYAFGAGVLFSWLIK